MQSIRRQNDLKFLKCLSLFAILLLPGCSPPTGESPSDDKSNEANLSVNPSSHLASSPLLSPEELCERSDEILQYTYDHRRLYLDKHAAWQILHGALTYKQDFLIRHTQGGDELFSAVDHILDGGVMQGWTVRITEIPGGGRGLRAILEPGTSTGQGHHDQWLAVLAQCGLPPETEIKVGSEILTMDDYVTQVKWDVASNFDREFSWTLIGLTTYMDTDAAWTASDGETWSIAKLVQIEAEQARDEYAGACGGTHRLIGLTMALNRHVDQGGEIEGPWLLAEEVIDQAIATIRQFQNADGSFSTNWLWRAGRWHSVDAALSTTGHQLEFLVLALPEEELHEEWVVRAATNLCNLFHATRREPLECGALYHAAHGLALYRERIFGEKVYRNAEGEPNDNLPDPSDD